MAESAERSGLNLLRFLRACGFGRLAGLHAAVVGATI
jgi:hypothetical protein